MSLLSAGEPIQRFAVERRVRRVVQRFQHIADELHAVRRFGLNGVVQELSGGFEDRVVAQQGVDLPVGDHFFREGVPQGAGDLFPRVVLLQEDLHGFPQSALLECRRHGVEREGGEQGERQQNDEQDGDGSGSGVAFFIEKTTGTGIAVGSGHEKSLRSILFLSINERNVQFRHIL